MDMQNVSSLQIPEGAIRTIHDKNNRLLWGRLAYDTKYAGDTYQQIYSGKNLFDSSLLNSNSTTSVLVSGNSITLTAITGGTNNRSVNMNIPNSEQLLGKTVTLSAKSVEFNRSTVNTGQILFLNNLGGGYYGELRINGDGGSTTFTLPSSFPAGASAFRLYIYIQDSSAGTPTINPGDYTTYSGIQLEIGSTATDYEPYVGSTPTQITPSPNPDYPQDVQVATGRQLVTISGEDQSQEYEINLGKNLFDLSTVFNSILNSDGSLSTNDVWRTSDYIKVDKNTTYIWHGTQIDPNSNNQFRWAGYDSSKGFISGEWQALNGQPSLSFTTSSSTAYIRVAFREDRTKDMQFEQGSTATSYAPYFTPIELCKIGDYQDYIYKSGDDWYVHKETGKVILTGSLFTRSNSYVKTYQIDKTALNQLLLPAGTTNIKSDYFHCVIDGTPAIGEVYSGNSYLNFNYDNVGDGNGLPIFRAWVDANKPMLYGVLATPTDTQITDSTLIGQLDSAHQWLTRYGYNATVAGNIPIIIDKTSL